MKKTNLLSVVIVISTLILFLGALWLDIALIDVLEFRFRDIISSVIKMPASQSPVVLIGIDEKSFQKIEQWPWQRSLVAEGVKTIEELGARAVVLDILYSEKDKNPGLAEIRTMLKKLSDDPSQIVKKDILELFPYLKMSKAEQKRYRDALLNASLAETQKMLIALLSEAEKRIDFDNLFAQKIAEVKNLLMPLQFPLEGSSKEGVSVLNPFLIRNSLPFNCNASSIRTAEAVVAPIPTFASRASALGHINLIHDIDGVVRKHPLFICFKERIFPSIELQALIKQKGITLEEAYNKGFSFIDNGTRAKEPLLDIFINPSSLKQISYFSFSDLQSGQLQGDKLKDKIVIIGLNSSRMVDFHKLSGSIEASPLFIRGIIIHNLMNRDYFSRSSWTLIAETVFLIILAILLALLSNKWLKASVVALLMLFLWTGISIYLFFSENLLMNGIYPWVFTVVLLAGLFTNKKRQEKKVKEGMAKDIFQTKRLNLIIGSKSDIGKVRDKNEDSYCIDKHLGMLAVADGVGGSASGEIASKMSLDSLSGFMRTRAFSAAYASDPSSLMRDAIQYANSEIVKASGENPQLHGMATTLSAAYVNDNRLVIGHVGDSRIYLFRGGRLEQLTEDHTVAVQSRKDLSSGDTEKLRHVLTRALGIQPFIEVDTFELNIVSGDILLLCTDGLYSMVSNDDIVQCIRSYKEPVMACGALVNQANKQGGKDNITVILTYISGKK